MKARLAVAPLMSGNIRPATGHPGPSSGSRLSPDTTPATSPRVAQARGRAVERRDRQRRLLRPLGLAFIAIVVIASLQSAPAPGIRGARLGVTLALAVYALAVATAISSGWAQRGAAAQGVAIALIGGTGVALAALQPHGQVELATSMAAWIAAIRLPDVAARGAVAAITASLAVTVTLTQQPLPQAVVAPVLLCLLLGVTGQFIRRGRDSQDRAELLLAQLQDARDAEAAAAALAERSRIAGELHDVLAHALSGLSIQLQVARKLAEGEGVSAGLHAAITRSAELAKDGLTDARHAVGALRGDRLPTVDQLGTLVQEFHRDTRLGPVLRIDGPPRPLPAEVGLVLYRAAQEALTNIARYAPGATVTIEVRYAPDRVQLTVENHACARIVGTDPRASSSPPLLADAGGGHGLTGMRERAERVGGTAKAGPTADGWRVELDLPA